MNLHFRSVCKLTLISNGEEGFEFVAMGFKITPTVLPGDVPGVAIKYIVNSPDRFEQGFQGRVVSDDPSLVVIERLPQDDDENPTIYYRFEPLTLENWQTMKIWDAGTLHKELTSDTLLQAYYWNDWVPGYWGAEEDPA